MKKLALALLLLAAPAYAQTVRPLHYGDSICGCGKNSAACPGQPANSSYPDYFRTALGLATQCQNCVDSRNACTALSQLAFNIAFCDLGGQTTELYIEHGNNGQFSYTPEQNADCILAMADMAANHVPPIRPHIILPPLVDPASPYNPQRRQFAEETIEFLYLKNLNGYDLIPDVLTTLSVCTADGVHPTVQACRQAMGARLAAWQ